MTNPLFYAKILLFGEYGIIEDSQGLTLPYSFCLLYTSDAADERSSVDLGGRRIIKKKKRTRAQGDPYTRNKQTRQDIHNIAQRDRKRKES